MEQNKFPWMPLLLDATAIDRWGLQRSFSIWSLHAHLWKTQSLFEGKTSWTNSTTICQDRCDDVREMCRIPSLYKSPGTLARIQSGSELKSHYNRISSLARWLIICKPGHENQVLFLEGFLGSEMPVNDSFGKKSRCWSSRVRVSLIFMWLKSSFHGP